jgi:hypothetical protein
MKNPWKYVTFEYKLRAHYYNPGGSLMGEIEDRIVAKPERETFWFTRGWGWETAGNWSPGVYRVEIFFDDEYRISREFAIFKDQVEKLFSFQHLPYLDRNGGSLFSKDFQPRHGLPFPKG